MSEKDDRTERISTDPDCLKMPLYHVLFSWKGFIVLMVILLPLKVLRAGRENSLWIDEVYTLLLSFRPWGEMVHLTALDNHPPLYYGLLKVWIGLGGSLGWLTELLWARLLNVILWLFFCLGTWLAGRRILGKPGGALLACAVACGAQVAQVSKDLRGYALAMFAVFMCFLLLLLIWKKPRTSSGTKEILMDGLLWGLYALFGLTALYSHLLTSFALLLLGLCWVSLIYRKKEGASLFFWGGAAAQGLILVLFIPWLIRITGQVSYVQSSKLLWMTPPTLWNLLRIFLFWFPYGQTPDPPIEAAFYTYVAGGLAFILPWGAFLWARGFSRRDDSPDTLIKFVAIFGGLVSVLFPVLLFLIRRITGIQVFHGPRYPCLVAPIWTAGLVAAALYAAGRLKRPLIFVFFLLIPWFFCNILGQIWSQSREKTGALHRWKMFAADFMPAKGEPLYILPPELIPYYKNSLNDYNVKRIEEIVNAPQQNQEILVLNISPWEVLQTPRDTIILSLIREGQLSRELEEKKAPKSVKDFRSFRLKGFDHDKVKNLFQDGIRPAKRDIPDSAVGVALPERQWLDEGWSVDEVDPKGYLFRWAMGGKTKVRFSGSIMPGMYTLHFVGFRPPHPRENEEFKFVFERERESYTVLHGAGNFHIEISVRIFLKHKNPVLKVRHPVWRPVDVEEGNKDTRPLTFLFLYAWLEPGTQSRKPEKFF